MTGEILTLAAWRRRRLLTIRALAAASGVATKTVIDLEANRRVPRPGTVRAISEVLGVAPEQVLEFRRAMGLPATEGDHES